MRKTISLFKFVIAFIFFLAFFVLLEDVLSRSENLYSAFNLLSFSIVPTLEFFVMFYLINTAIWDYRLAFNPGSAVVRTGNIIYIMTCGFAILYSFLRDGYDTPFFTIMFLILLLSIGIGDVIRMMKSAKLLRENELLERINKIDIGEEKWQNEAEGEYAS